ncbi:hypothetical protein KEM55_007385 [Ascosphaera atra]|nr:hypothetical protein KEM55_007385 [Ascosphaera atra]
MDAPPPGRSAARSVTEIISSADQTFQVLGPVLRGVGLRLAYVNDPSYAQDPDPPFEKKLRLMVRWAREMDRVLVDRSWHEEMLCYLTGCHLKRVQRQIAADPRLTEPPTSDVFDPPLSADQLSHTSNPSARPVRARRERPLSLLAAADTARGSPSPKRTRRQAAKAPSTSPTSSPSDSGDQEGSDSTTAESDDEEFRTGEDEGEQDEGEQSEEETATGEEGSAKEHPSGGQDASALVGSSEAQGGDSFQPDNQGLKQGGQETPGQSAPLSLSATPAQSARALHARFRATGSMPSPSAMIDVSDSPTPVCPRSSSCRQSTLLESFLKKAPQTSRAPAEASGASSQPPLQDEQVRSATAERPREVPPASSSPIPRSMPPEAQPGAVAASSAMPPPPAPAETAAPETPSVPVGKRGPTTSWVDDSPLPQYESSPAGPEPQTPSRPAVGYESPTPELSVTAVRSRPCFFQLRPQASETQGHREYPIKPSMQWFKRLAQRLEQGGVAWKETWQSGLGYALSLSHEDLRIVMTEGRPH